jgi:hypothetical protein
VLVLAALICQILADSASVSGLQETLARSGVPVAAVLFPAGFFLSSMGKGRTGPNRLIGLLYAGAAILAVSVVAFAGSRTTAVMS